MRFDVPIGQYGVHNTHPKEPESTKKKARSSFRLKPRLRKPRTTTVVTIVAVVSILALVSLSGFLLWQNNKLKHESQSSADNGQQIAEDVISSVDKLYALPKDEDPTVATVKDVEQLKDQAFFADAENGDNLLVYSEAKIAILYRKSNNKIINVGPVSDAPVESDQLSEGQ